MSEESVAIDWLRAKTISYESSSEELHYALILYNLIMNLQQENQELKNQLERAKSKLTTMFANADDDKVLDDLLELGKILEVE